ncbi:MAG: DUF427 domain-containing protein [Leptolyngbyaceae bacterium]|nr:DUF427 domain-containing protein [Leptolyngbyaceae bacterium]
MIRPTPIPPQPGQESVWDYPRPAQWENTNKHLKVVFNGVVIAETRQGRRILETSHPPTYYFPESDVNLDYVIQTPDTSLCEWKGRAYYYDVVVNDKKATHAAWRFFEPTPGFVEMTSYYCFVGRQMDACYVDGELATPQAGNYYGGWITKDLAGPFKGGPGTMGW